MNMRTKAFALAASFVVFAVLQSFGQNVLVNGSFESGTPPLDWTAISGWSSSQVGGGTVVAGAAQDGSDYLDINAFGSGTKLLDQRWAATAGQFYETDAFMMTPAGANQFNPVAGQVLLIMQFYDNGGTKIGSNIQAPAFASGGPTTWTQFTTGSTLAPGGTVTGRTIIVYLGSTDSTTAGQVYVDNVRSVLSGGSTCGLADNPGFEDGPLGDCFDIDPTSNTNVLSDDLPGWDWFGGDNTGFIQDSFVRSGGKSLAIFWTENLAGQEFAATPGMSYIYEGYIYNPSAQPFTGNARGTLLLEFADITPGSTTVLLAVESAPFLAGGTQDTWIPFAVTGQAPSSVSGTLRARAFCAILGTDVTGLGGGLYFDDTCITETNIAGGTSSCGVLEAPGFEETPAGTQLVGLNAFSAWTNFGIAGGVQNAVKRSGDNALQFFFTETLAGQFFPANPGERYTANGYALTPSSNPMGGTTNAQALAGLVILEFVDSTATNVLASYASQPFTISTPQDVWTNLTSLGSGLAPVGTVEGRVLVGVVGNETGFTGEVYFDDLCATLVSSGLVNNCGDLANAGYDDGLTGNAFELDASGQFAGWSWFGGTNAGFVQSDIQRDGGQALGITFPENLAAQDVVVSTGATFVFEGYIQNPSLVNGATTTLSGPARGTLLMSFLDPLVTITNITTNQSPFEIITNIQPQTISAVEPLDVFTTNDASDVWKYVSVTGRAPNSVSSGAGTVTARVFSAILGDITGFEGALFFDTLCLTDQLISGPALTQDGAIFNPGFEFTPNGTGLRYVDSWINLGFDGAVLERPFARSGKNALNIFFPETLVQQENDWPVTPGNRYRSRGYAYTEAGARLSGSTNAGLVGVVIQQFINSTGGVIDAFTVASAPFTTNSPVDTWVELTAEGVAPVGAVAGRTIVGLVGLDDAFSGSIWFDDLSQALVSTAQAPCGELVNGSFENGPAGNAYFLDPTSNTNIPLPPDDLPGWSYGGGDNAMFITSDESFDGAQSAVATFPNNVLIQDFAVTAGETYTLDGRMFTPSGADQFASDGTSFGLLVLQFYENGQPTNVTVSATSAPFAHTNAPDVWQSFQATATAPASPQNGIVTGQVVAFIFSPDPGADFDLGGVIRFDDLCVTAGSGVSEFEQWQLDNFGSTTAPGTGPQEDFDGDGASNENEFIAGTEPTDNSSLLAPIAERNLPSTTQVSIKWESATGRYYDILRTTVITSDTVNADFTVIQTNVVATPPQNTYIDTPPASGNTYYYRVSATTNTP